MWFDPGLAGLFITSTLLHLGEDINLLIVSKTLSICSSFGQVQGGRFSFGFWMTIFVFSLQQWLSLILGFKLIDQILFEENLALRGHLCFFFLSNCSVFFFLQNFENIYIYMSEKIFFLCVAYGQYPNMFWMFFFKKNKILEVSKICFRMDFLNTTKNLLAFLDFTTCL